MKTTFKKLQEIDSVVAGLYTKNPTLKEGKFGYAYKRFYEKNYEKVLEEYRAELADIRIDNALEDEKTKAILKDLDSRGRGFQYSKESLKAVLKAERGLDEKWNAKEIEVEPFFIKPENLPELTENQVELLKGTIIE